MNSDFDPRAINKLRLDLNKIKMQCLAGQLQNTSDLKKKKKELARVYTQLTMKRLGKGKK